jgi:alpha-1,6-mannosyltransferase
VKRYLCAKRAWLAAHRPGVRATLVAPGPRHGQDASGEVSIYAAPLPFADGYRWPVSRTAWMKRLMRQCPDLIEAGDPYTPGLAAQRAGAALGVPVVGFCHTDLAALAAAHIGDWAEKPIRRHWAEIYRRFDRVIAPSRYIARRLAEAGVTNALTLPLGVDTGIFRPRGGAREALRRRLGLTHESRLLVFAGRNAREKRLDVLAGAVERLGDPYRLLLIGPAGGAPGSPRTMTLPYQSDPHALASLMAGCDAFVHANDAEAFGLVVLEAMACGLPVAAMAAGGVAESVDAAVGALASSPTPAALAEAIEDIFARGAPTLGAAARRRAMEQHGWDAVFSKLCRLYGEMTGRDAFTGPARALLN